MNEIEQEFYLTFGIKPYNEYWCKRFDKTRVADCNGIKNPEIECAKCENGYIKTQAYPEFTAEKQLDLIKWIINKGKDSYLQIAKEDNKYYAKSDCMACYKETFEESLIGLINYLWADLTAEEKAEIRNILKG